MSITIAAKSGGDTFHILGDDGTPICGAGLTSSDLGETHTVPNLHHAANVCRRCITSHQKGGD